MTQPLSPREADALMKCMSDSEMFELTATLEERQAYGRAIWMLHAYREARGLDELPRWAGGRE